jgi:hypothetical protein
MDMLMYVLLAVYPSISSLLARRRWLRFVAQCAAAAIYPNKLSPLSDYSPRSHDTPTPIELGFVYFYRERRSLGLGW